jgi:hypothetical protein
MPDEKDETPESIEVKLNFRIPPRMPTVYAHHMLVQQGEFEVILSFFEVTPPILVEQIAEADRIKFLQETGLIAECVARVTIAKDRFPGFAQALQQIMGQITTPKGPQDDANNTRDNPES